MVGIFFIIKDGVDLQKTTALLTETDDPRLTEASEKRKKWLAVVSSRTRGLKWVLIYKLKVKIHIASHMLSMMDLAMSSSAAVTRHIIHSLSPAATIK